MQIPGFLSKHGKFMGKTWLCYRRSEFCCFPVLKWEGDGVYVHTNAVKRKKSDNEGNFSGRKKSKGVRRAVVWEQDILNHGCAGALEKLVGGSTRAGWNQQSQYCPQEFPWCRKSVFRKGILKTSFFFLLCSLNLWGKRKWNEAHMSS